MPARQSGSSGTISPNRKSALIQWCQCSWPRTDWLFRLQREPIHCGEGTLPPRRQAGLAETIPLREQPVRWPTCPGPARCRIANSDWFGVHEIAERAGVSPATASETLIAVERREWVEVRGAGPSKERRLNNPRALLDAWSNYQGSVKPKAVRHYYVRSTTPPDCNGGLIMNARLKASHTNSLASQLGKSMLLICRALPRFPAAFLLAGRWMPPRRYRGTARPGRLESWRSRVEVRR
jgi:hypothetical protein